MLPRSQIQRTPGNVASVDRIVEILATEEFASRGAFGQRICEKFGFADAWGWWQLARCLKALGVLAGRSDRVMLPPPQRPPIPSAPVRLDGPVAPPVGVPGRLDRLWGLTVELVGDHARRRIWNTLIADEHPHGLTTFTGC